MSRKTGAKVSALAKLHERLAEVMLQSLENPEGLKAADLMVISKFLKDNNIEATEDNPKIREIKEKVGNILDFPFTAERETG